MKPTGRVLGSGGELEARKLEVAVGVKSDLERVGEE